MKPTNKQTEQVTSKPTSNQQTDNQPMTTKQTSNNQQSKQTRQAA
jgi:hypothetical protein